MAYANVEFTKPTANHNAEEGENEEIIYDNCEVNESMLSVRPGIHQDSKGIIGQMGVEAENTYEHLQRTTNRKKAFKKKRVIFKVLMLMIVVLLAGMIIVLTILFTNTGRQNYFF